jgi:hypothetical protein
MMAVLPSKHPGMEKDNEATSDCKQERDEEEKKGVRYTASLNTTKILRILGRGKERADGPIDNQSVLTSEIVTRRSRNTVSRLRPAIAG